MIEWVECIGYAAAVICFCLLSLKAFVMLIACAVDAFSQVDDEDSVD